MQRRHPFPLPNSLGTTVGRSAVRPIHLAFVEDDADFREAAGYELGDHGFVVDSFCDGGTLLAFLWAGISTGGIRAEIILLDWDLPGLSGIDLLPRLRTFGIALPVVFFTGRSQPGYEKLALDGGAVDFVDKARGVPILAERLKLIAGRDCVGRAGGVRPGR